MVASPRTVAILLAAGQSRRAGAVKQFQKAEGRTLLEWACDAFVECREIHGLLIVSPAADLRRVSHLARKACADQLLSVVAGGRTRHESSRAGLAALPESCDTVLIHDVARPFVSGALIRRVVRAARDQGAAIPAVAIRDSIVESTNARRVRRYHARDRLQKVQTPQGFRRTLLEDAFSRTRRRDWSDDASVVRAAGRAVLLVDGEETNRKITTVAELALALRLLAGS